MINAMFDFRQTCNVITAQIRRLKNYEKISQFCEFYSLLNRKNIFIILKLEKTQVTEK